MKIPNRREFQQTVLNHLPDIDSKDFMKLYKDYIKEPGSFLGNNATLPSDNWELRSTRSKWLLTRKSKQLIKIEQNKVQ